MKHTHKTEGQTCSKITPLIFVKLLTNWTYSRRNATEITLQIVERCHALL